MKTGYILFPTGSSDQITTMPSACINCASSCNVQSEIHKCTLFKETRRRGLINIKEGILYLCTNDAIDSKRIFKEKLVAARELAPTILHHKTSLNEAMNKSVRQIVHNLVTLNAESLQTIYSSIPQDSFSQPDRETLISHIAARVKGNPTSIAQVLIDLVKNESLVKAEFSVYAKLYEKEPPQPRPYSIHKIVMMILSTFWDDFMEHNVRLVMGSTYSKTFFDYDALATSLIHILQNTTKYILPKTTLKIRFETTESHVLVYFDMISLRIEPDEEQSIFYDGYSGKNTIILGRNGKGIGLFQVTKLLALCAGEIVLRRDQKPELRQMINGLWYDNNVFVLVLPLYATP